jgi:hypothetical protein
MREEEDYRTRRRVTIGERLRCGIEARDEIVKLVNFAHNELVSHFRSEGLPAWIKISVDSRLLSEKVEVAGDCGPIDGYSSSRG